MAKPAEIRPISGSRKVCMLLYAPPGAGKTRLIGERKRTLIVRPPTDHVDSIRTVGAEEWIVYSWAEMNNVHEYARHDGAKDFDWIWLDSISLFQDTGLDDIWDGLIVEKPHRAQYRLDKGEYGVNMWRLEQWVRHMVGIPGFNLGIAAHPAEVINPIDGELKLQPWIQGKNMSTKIQGYMNIVAYLEVVKQNDGERRVLRTRGTERYEAKDQFDAFKNGRLVDPTMAKIERAIKTARPDMEAAAKRNGRAARRRAARPTTKKVARR